MSGRSVPNPVSFSKTDFGGNASPAFFLHTRYDLAGRMTEMDSSADGLTSYTHDATNQLTSADYAAGGLEDESFFYDDNGNRVSTTVGSTQTSYYNDTGNLLTFDGVYTYTYDMAGNRTARYIWVDDGDGVVEYGERYQMTFYTWDHRNRLVSSRFVHDEAYGPQLPIIVIDYIYNPFDQLVAKQVNPHIPLGGQTYYDEYFYYLYQGDNLYAELTDLDGLANPTQPTTVSQRYLYGQAVDQILAVEDEADGEVYWTLADHEGTIRDIAVYDDVLTETTIVEHRRYDSFGQLLDPAGGSGVPVAQGYTGRPLDEDTGLMNYRARWYDPVVGRFVSEDPSGFDGGDANLYRYCGNNPMTNVDPMGLCYTGSFASSYNGSTMAGELATLGQQAYKYKTAAAQAAQSASNAWWWNKNSYLEAQNTAQESAWNAYSRIEQYRSQALSNPAATTAVVSELTQLNAKVNWGTAIQNSGQFRNAIVGNGQQLAAMAAERQANAAKYSSNPFVAANQLADRLARLSTPGEPGWIRVRQATWTCWPAGGEGLEPAPRRSSTARRKPWFRPARWASTNMMASGRFLIMTGPWATTRP
jgi:RHS repeat-associated protein